MGVSESVFGSANFLPEISEETRTINFDELQNGTDVRNHYPDIKFSSDFGQLVSAARFWAGNQVTSYPNDILVDYAKSNLYIDFPRPVKDLSFWVTSPDDYGTIFYIAWYRNNAPAGAVGFPGTGPSHAPVFVNFAGITDITKVIVYNITDTLGIGYDDFRFTFTSPPPTPTPTPGASPTPSPNVAPAAPNLLSATAGDQEVSLQWTVSQNAATYKVKQLTDGGIPVTGGTVTVGGPATSYTVRNLAPNVRAYFAVSALNSHGESANSNTLSAIPTHNCGAETFQPRPTPASWDGGGWHFDSEVSDRDGLVIKNVTLNGRPMAVMMSLPYFEVKTDRMNAPGRGELTPDNPDTSAPLRTRLISYSPIRVELQPGHVTTIGVQARYAVDNISPGSKSCLFINQQYTFNKTVPGDGCELSATLPCARYYPRVTYTFVGRDDEHLQSIRLPQRLHYETTDNEGRGVRGNTVGVFKDCDILRIDPITRLPITCTAFDITSGPVFSRKDNPVHWEFLTQMIRSGQPNPLGVDNYHQSADPVQISEPPHDALHGMFGGCPDCVHMHWRWGADAARISERIGLGRFGQGKLIGIPPGSNQDMDAGALRYWPGEDHPIRVESIRNQDPIRRFVMPNDTKHDFNDPYDVVFWYVGTGHQDNDEFFNHGAFFNPNLGANVPRSISPSGSSSGNQTTSSTSADGPTSVAFGYLYQEGEVTFEQMDPTVVGPLPSGYSLLNSFGHDIHTNAVFSGQNIVTFSVPSVTNQTTFGNLRILHAEKDPFDPEGHVWVDRTILSPDPLTPSFDTHTINARVSDLGEFVIAVLSQTPSTNTADLSISMSHSPEPVAADTDLTYTITVSNSGPQTATEVGLLDALSRDVGFVSVSTTQGVCKFSDGTIYCKLGTIANGSNAIVTMMVRPTEVGVKFPPEGQVIKAEAMANGNENDPNAANNSATESVTALPSSNARPSVSITSPTFGSLFVGPTNISLTAQAIDSDGSIYQVDFYDGETLIGSGIPTSTPNQYRLDWNNPAFGLHTLHAVATDNGSKVDVSNPINVLVNGPATVSITSPTSGIVLGPGAIVSINATANHPTGSITKVEFVTDGRTIGEGTFSGGNQYNITWTDIVRGNYVLSAIATDNAGIQTISAPINVTITTRPTVNIITPIEGTSYPSGPNVMVNAQAQGTVINKVEFYADGALLGSGVAADDDRFIITWRNAPDGIHSLTAVATDDLGLRTASTAVNISVNSGTPSTSPGEFIWFDDALPQGATPHGDGESWYWVDANPGALSGTKSHQSRNFAQLDLPNNSFHQHYFDGATTKLPVNAGDKLFTYVFLDINNMPREIMLQWNDGNGWEHRAYWGTNRINVGTDGSNSRRYMGPLPKAGQWVRLEVPASAVGLEGSTLSGMAFALDAGRATFDLAGKTTQNAPPLPTTPDEFVWFEDAAPAGSILEAIDDQWSWEPPAYSGQFSHRSYFTSNQGNGQFRSHSFRAAQAPMTVEPGAVLFTYVYVDPNHKPDELVLQWHDGSSWEHRAYWGQNFFPGGTTGTESRRYMGGIPTAGQWVRLEVPASYVGLEGKTVSGMAFGFYSVKDRAGINWDRSGKSSQAAKPPQPLSALTPVYRFFNSNYGWSYATNDIGLGNRIPEGLKFYVHPNQAAGTVPFYRFRNSNSGDSGYFYSQNSPNPDIWAPDGIAFYVYPDGTTPGTVPLHLFHDIHFRYFLTTDYNEGVSKGLSYDAVWAHVFATNPLVPARPYLMLQSPWVCGDLSWATSSSNVTGFKIERRFDWESNWRQIASVSADIRAYYSSCSPEGASQSSQNANPEAPEQSGGSAVYFRIRATSPNGDSEYSHEVVYHSCPQGMVCPDGTGPGSLPPNASPEITITSPANGDVVTTDFTIAANAFDSDGNGTIAKVEFFAGSNKLGESAAAPYLFVWNSVPPGTHVLTAKATDTAGATTTSSGVTVTVNAPTPTPTPTPSPSASPTATPVPMRENVALASNGATATASSAYAGWAASGTNNGERKGLNGGQNGGWVTAQTGFPAWLQVDFNGSKTIDEIDVFTIQDNWANPSEPTEAMTFSLYGLTGYEVQYWNGTSWVTVPGASVTGNTKVWRKFTFAPVVTTKVRVLTNASTDGFSRLAEVEAWTAPPPRTNFSLAANGAVATASSAYSGWAASGAINGDRKGLNGGQNGGWVTAQTGFPAWLQVDFNGSKTIDEIDVFTIQDNWANPSEPTEAMTFSLYGLTGYEVQYWNGTSWVTVPGASVTGNTKVWRKFTFAPVVTTKVRVLTNASTDGSSRLAEVEAWSPSP